MTTKHRKLNGQTTDASTHESIQNIVQVVIRSSYQIVHIEACIDMSRNVKKAKAVTWLAYAAVNKLSVP